ncbi:transmembrane amino acid transporter protein-domain-containing protein [Lipomyces japonicus]|uniref:transmembrane amino acid transporter protein-domain-containing protein n=1 Tax=Lipomyces japonicus TaxID=56871 RepID=UPI0034CFFCAF
MVDDSTTRTGADQKRVVVAVVPGRSTAPQTVFNSVNVLIGIGLLSLPLAMSYAGWLIGCTFMIVAAGLTLYTAKILARCLDTDPTLVTYADIAYAAYGSRARVLTSLLFSLELLGACVALVVLFADSINSLLPQFWSKTKLKIAAFFILTPLSFLPLSVLSFSSILGILSTFGILLIVLIDGLIKREPPGSLWKPSSSSILPSNWKTVPLSLGLLMSPWCGHSVFPNVYRDMRHPYKFNRCLNLTYFFTFVVDMSMGVLGLLMFGDDYVTEEITNTIVDTSGYPGLLNVVMTILIAFIPLSKTPLNARPIITTIEVMLGVTLLIADRPYHKGNFLTSPQFVRIMIRLGINALFVIIAIVFPSFDRIMALVGSALGFTICLVLPLAFYLKIFNTTTTTITTNSNRNSNRSAQRNLEQAQFKIPDAEVVFDMIVIIAGTILAVVGGAWALLPDSFIFS